MAMAMEQMEIAMREKGSGTLTHPPRIAVDSPDGALVFTVGAATGAPKVAGFRAYYRPSKAGAEVNDEQVVAVYDSASGALRGVVTGRTLGATRTAAINGVAIQRLARAGAATLSVIGAGYHARFQIAAALAVRPITSAHIASRTLASAEKLAGDVAARYGIAAEATTDREAAVAAADILICATNSREPVLQSSWLRPGTHINAIGPKVRGAHELPLDIAGAVDLMATDSLAQVNGYGQPFFLPDLSGMVELDQIVAGQHPGRQTAEEITLFCSVGLAGTEVVLADALLASIA